MAAEEQKKQPKMTPFDSYPTPTSDVQHETEEILLKHLPGDDDGAQSPFALHKPVHMQFLVKHLIKGFPVRYISQDASQPWLLFWILQAFSCMGVVLDPDNRQRYVRAVLGMRLGVD